MPDLPDASIAQETAEMTRAAVCLIALALSGCSALVMVAAHPLTHQVIHHAIHHVAKHYAK